MMRFGLDTDGNVVHLTPDNTSVYVMMSLGLSKKPEDWCVFNSIHKIQNGDFVSSDLS